MSANHSNSQFLSGSYANEHKGFIYNLIFGPGGAATLAGICEIILFHPFDTAAKRLMSHQHRVFDPTSLSNSWFRFQKVLFKDIEHYKSPNISITIFDYIKHMYPGSLYAITYKVLQRFVKFAGQPYMRDFLNYKFGYYLLKNPTTTTTTTTTNQIKENDGKLYKRQKNYGAMILEATAGSLVGICEVILLPIDRMKILNQTNKEAIQNRSFLNILRQEGIIILYAGAGITTLRNTIGAFLLFGGTAFTKEYIFLLDDYREATFLQNIISSTVGGCIGVFCVNPIDVVKTRIQNKKFKEGHITGWNIIKETIKREGFSAFYKGISPKILTAAPRLVFSYTMTQFFTKRLRGEKTKSSST